MEKKTYIGIKDCSECGCFDIEIPSMDDNSDIDPLDIPVKGQKWSCLENGMIIKDIDKEAVGVPMNCPKRLVRLTKKIKKENINLRKIE